MWAQSKVGSVEWGGHRGAGGQEIASDKKEGQGQDDARVGQEMED